MGDKGIWKGVSVFGECQLDNAGFQFLKVFWNLGEQGLAFVCCLEHEILSPALLTGRCWYLHGLLPCAVGQEQGTGSFARGQ